MAWQSKIMVEKTDINVPQLVNLLIKNAAAELATYYYYTILRVNMVGMEAAGIKDIAESARIEDRNHFEALIPRIYELGGKLPENLKDFYSLSVCPPAVLPRDPTDNKALLNTLVEAERCAANEYSRICDLTAGKDHRTYDLALAILNEEVEHETWVSEFLGQGPSGRPMRRGKLSPFVSKFLK
jgi:ferritin-like protein